MPVPSDRSNVKGGKEYTILDDNIYNVVVKDVELKENVQTKFGLRDNFLFTLEVINDIKGSEKFKGQKLFYRTSIAFNSAKGGNKASKLYDLACAVYKENLDANNGIEVNTLIDGELRVYVSPIVKDGVTYNDIKTVMRSENKSTVDAPVLSDDEKSFEDFLNE